MGATELVLIIVFLIVGVAAGYLIRQKIAAGQASSAENEAQKMIEDAKHASETLKKEIRVQAQEEALALRKEAETEIKELKNDVLNQQRRLEQREESLDQKLTDLEKKQQSVSDREGQLDEKNKKVDELITQQQRALESVAQLTADEAKRQLIAQIEDDAKRDAALLVKEIEVKAKDEADRKARWIITNAIQRCASDHVAESTVSVVEIPSDDMKGRIIGREGRNIRLFETLTGINLIIDDTPEAVILSSFDPIRREIGRLTLQYLISDGRIHPARIEEMYEKARKEVDNEIKEAGDQAVMDAGVYGLHPELVKAMGRLKYRTSYGQNVLLHSTEVAHLCGLMAAELGIDIKTAKRAGLLHDLGKAIDHEVEGPHAQIGADLARRLGEPEVICHAIEAHHEDIEPTSLEPILVQAADAISSARPGARRESLESYIKRLEKLEEIATSMKGVEKCYAMQAGREIRIMVKPSEVDDARANLMAKDVAKRIEEELEYPGQIKVTVIRENRVTEFAR